MRVIPGAVVGIDMVAAFELARALGVEARLSLNGCRASRP